MSACVQHCHYSDVMMSAIASQIDAVSSVYLTVCSVANQRKYQSSTSLACVRGIHRWPVNFPYKGPVTRKIFHLMTSSCDCYWAIVFRYIPKNFTWLPCPVWNHLKNRVNHFDMTPMTLWCNPWYVNCCVTKSKHMQLTFLYSLIVKR